MKKPQREAMDTSNPKPASESAGSAPHAALLRTHLLWGWCTLLVFLTVGLILEAFHGFKVAGYLKVTNETRRLLWTLAHAHGTLFGLINLAFFATLKSLPTWPEPNTRFASITLRAATVLMPVGFFVGGLFIYGGDPGLGILLVPIGGLLLLVSVGATLRGASRYFLDPDDN